MDSPSGGRLRELLGDAFELLKRERWESGLTLVLAAIAATSRRRFPPNSAISSGDAFVRFLEDEEILISSGRVARLSVAYPLAHDPKFGPNRLVPWPQFMYLFARCHLMHEGTLPAGVAIGEPNVLRVTADGVQFGPDRIYGLVRIVEVAPENDAEFPEVNELGDVQLAKRLFHVPESDLAVAYMARRRERIDALNCARSSKGLK